MRFPKPAGWIAVLIVAVTPGVGTLAQAGDPGPPAEAPAADAPAAEEAAAGPRSEEVTYINGPLPLAAELLLPASEEPVPGAVILQGSGTSDRSNAWARAIAEELRDNGLAVLLTDKRGSGASGGDWRTAGFGDLAGDGLAGVEYLRGRPEVDPERIGLVGLSQGGWVAPIAAAARPGEVAFVVSLSGAAVSFAEQSFFELANTARQAGLAEPQVQAVLEANRLAAQYLLTGEWEPYAQAREEGLESPWAQIAEGFPASAEAPIWTFLRRVASFDPIPYWLQLRQPVLVVYGAQDEADNVPVAESLRRLEHAFGLTGKENAEILVLPDAGHALLTDDRSLHPGLTEALAAWLAAHVTGKPAPAPSPP